MNIVEINFKGKGILRNNVYVYQKKVAIDFINECRRYGIDILGIDAFIMKENFHQPSMENSIDFSEMPELKNSHRNIWDLAIAFLNERDNIYYFEIVCSE
jgi:hypothetical protein